jgi:UDP-GlcNAc:undecaprenyl-phosphate/decaprenyl-phosphate GlcNAc-1-phosphate transferase
MTLRARSPPVGNECFLTWGRLSKMLTFLPEAAPTAFISLLSFGICYAIVKLGARLPIRMQDLGAVQAAHSAPTPRLGGVGILIALSCGLALFAPASLYLSLQPFLVAIMPVFVVGLAEDIGWAMSPARRLFAAALSSIMVVALFDTQIARADVPGLDWALGFAGIGFVFTVLWTTGICNAINLIDGLNGFASGTCMMMAIGLAMMAHIAGDAELAAVTWMLVPALFGFLVLNWPLGRIFLGDSGAYTLGHILAWLGIFLLNRNGEVAGTAVGLLFFWPVADTLFSIYRRYRAGRRPDAPDRLHFHQLVMRGLEIMVLGRRDRKVSNPVAALLLMPLVAAPICTAVVLWNRPTEAFIAIALFSALFVVSYMTGMRLAQGTMRRTAASRTVKMTS